MKIFKNKIKRQKQKQLIKEDLLVGGDRTFELVPMQTDGGDIILVEPTMLLEYPRDI
jgi:hypothetical protein